MHMNTRIPRHESKYFENVMVLNSNKKKSVKIARKGVSTVIYFRVGNTKKQNRIYIPKFFFVFPRAFVD